MGNAKRGEFAFTVNDERYTLQFTLNGFCELEEVTGETTTAFMARLDQKDRADMSFKDVRRLFWAGLVEHHEGITEREAGRLVTALGGPVDALDFAMKALLAAFPEAKDESAGDAGNVTGAA